MQIIIALTPISLSRLMPILSNRYRIGAIGARGAGLYAGIAAACIGIDRLGVDSFLAIGSNISLCELAYIRREYTLLLPLVL